MFATFSMLIDANTDVNTINTWAEPHNANGEIVWLRRFESSFLMLYLYDAGVTPNTIIDSNDEPAGNNQQRIIARNY